MEGNGTENPCSRTLGWLHQNNDAKPWLWKFSGCFSLPEQTLPLSSQTKEYMENKKAAVELKDIPSPLHVGSKFFPAVPLPDIHSLQQPKVQLSAIPKVSCCAHCPNEPSTSPMPFGGGSGSSGRSGSLIHTGSLLDSPSTGTVTCQVGSDFAFQSVSSLQNASARNNLVGLASDLPSMCVDSNLPSCKHLSCCGKFHFQSCRSNVHKLHQFQTLQGCTSAGYFPCSDFPSEAPGHLEEHLSHSELTPHLCTNSLHLNVAPPVCLKGSLYCEDCLNKPARNSIIDAAKIWPNIPPPSTQPAPRAVPLCNRCGTKGMEKETSLLATSLGKAASKFGSPEVAVTGQVLETLPPIGVFWDIENCSVPSGRSATTVVQRIREKFFRGHREAEFICVCDISKENKEVIQELNNCQVTVAHINATAKNAADDKLRQSLRRFANTHTAPATVVLVSTDVNFALELSDLRHRHGFHIILVHKNQASEALLHHANQLIRFEEFISDLPPRLPLKIPCHTLLYVYNLPANKDGKSISNRLRRLSDNCGGKVLSITGCSAILRFINQDSAERAQKRMENEDVFGNRIIVSFTPKHRECFEAKSSNAVVDKAKSPKKVKNTKLCLIKDTGEQSPSAKAMPGKGLQANSGSATKNTNFKGLQELCRMEPKSGNRIRDHQQGHGSLATLPNSGPTASVPTLKNTGVRETLHRSSQKKENLSSQSIASSPAQKKKREGTVFQISYPSAFSQLIASRQVSPLFSSQSWSPRSMSPNLLNTASPLAFNIANPSSAADCSDPFANGVDIQVSNVDYRLSRKELQQLLQEAFSKHGQVKSVELSPHTDYQLKAIVQMRNLHDAICAVNSLHRYKIGSKKILVSLSTGAANKSLSLLSTETMSILQDAPACCLPLFKFIDIYEKKYGHKLNVSDLYKLTDMIAIREQGNGRLVCLLPSNQARQSPLGSSQSHDGSSTNCSPVLFEELEYHESVCKQHCSNKDFSELVFDPDSYKVPFVVLSLKVFAPQVHSLLQTHEGTVPLLSFPDCYAAEFGDLEITQDRDKGVPLEHFITCIPGVNIATAQNGVKVVKWIHNKPPPPNTDPWLLRSKSPVRNPQLIQFSREVIDLLKNQPSCILPISNFIPLYHHHFGKQCRVSDYGYSKLIELLEAVPHVLQILGMGSKRLLTLTHRAQVKRFTQDLLKLLKSQASKQVIVSDFSQAYHWCFSKDWDVTEYGVCDLIDIISEIPDTTICLSQQDDDMVICIRKRERTQDEIERTKQFSKDVVDLLRHAFTASDYTMYPFSTQNPKDFQNLLSVYLDATFFPCLRELDFWQEGWRLEHEDPSDPQTPLIFKGVVFNEMKGAFTDNERIFSQHLQNKLLPDHTYSVVSGGDPLCIPELTWEQLKQFHTTHYHPSNARFFTYGNFPLEDHLKQIHEEALSKFQKMEESTAVPAQKYWDKPREFHITCGPDSLATDATKQTTVSVSFLLPDITNTFEAFTLNLLSSLLISGPNSPFYKALIESGLGTDFSPDVGYNGYTREAYFSVGLQGIAEKDVKTVRELVDRTVEEVIEKGFEDDQIEALLHKIEIQMKHQSASFGMALTSYIASCWNHDGDPVELLQMGSQLTKFRKCLKENPKFLQEKVEQYFKNNPHRLTLSMKPDDRYYEKQTQMETEKLEQKVNSLSQADKKQIYEKGLELQKQQSKHQDASCLPALKVSDIEPTMPFTKFDIALSAGDVPVQYCPQPTNGIVYFRAFSSLNTLPEELRPFVPLFCSVLTKLGCGILNYREQAQQIELKTGGMTVTPHVLPDDSQLDTYEQGVLFSSLCLERNLPDMMHLWSEIFNNPCFEEEEHFKVLVRMSAQELSNGIPDSGHLYAALRAGKTLTPAGDLQETFSGMDQVKVMKRIAEMTDIKPILRKLPRIKKYLLNCDNMRCSVNATPQQMPQAEKEVENFLRNVGRSKKERKPVRPHIVEKPTPSGPSGGAHADGSQIIRKLITDPTFKPCQMKTHFVLPFPVNYVGECVRTVPYADPDHASLKILARLMTAKFLHTEIREKGGAYGGGAKVTHTGIFTLYSYRDPNSIETLQSFGKAIDWAKSGKFTQQDIDEAKLSVFSAVDSPVAPSDKGMDHFLYGLSDEMKQTYREQLFAVTHDKLTSVSHKYLGIGKSTHGLAILGPENSKLAKDPSWIIR